MQLQLLNFSLHFVFGSVSLLLFEILIKMVFSSVEVQRELDIIIEVIT